MGPRDVPIPSSSSSWRGGRPSGRIVGEVRGVDPEGVAVPFLPVAEGYRTETAAQTFPCCGSGIALGEDWLHDGAGHFQQLVDQERQQHQRSESIRQVLGSVSEVVFQVLGVLQRVEGLVLDLPATASRASQFAGVMRIERQIGDPGKRPPRILAGATLLRALQHLDLQVGVRSIQFRLRHHAQLAIPLLPFGQQFPV